jgi:hypothetical protein
MHSMKWFPRLVRQTGMIASLWGAAVCLSVSIPVAAAELSGRQIVDTVAERHEQPFEFEKQVMTLTDKTGNAEQREVTRYSRKEGDGEFRYLVAFHSPPGVKGVAVLTWQHADKDDDQWLYLPRHAPHLPILLYQGRSSTSYRRTRRQFLIRRPCRDRPRQVFRG